MTGTVMGLAAVSRTGTIRMPDGTRLPFSAEAVLGDFDALAIGHRVSLAVEGEGARRRVTRVFHEPVKVPVHTGSLDRPPDLRYAGFTQAANIRVYRFNVLTPGQCAQHSIRLDMVLLLKHHVGMQEVPALCLNKVATDLKTRPDSVSHELTEDNLREFACSRAAALERKRPKHSFTGRRGTPPPGPAVRGHLP